MAPISRRTFLKVCGVAAAASGWISIQEELGSFLLRPQPLGRTLTTALVFDRPNRQVIGRLLPDSVVTLNAVDGQWFLTSEGYVLQTELQPMHAAAAPTFPDAFPALVEVCTPSAVVREAASTQSRLVARIGHGGVSRVVDFLPDPGSDGGWYALQVDDGRVLGWTPAARWHMLPAMAEVPTVDRLTIELSACRCTAYVEDIAAGSFPVAVGEGVSHGTYYVASRAPFARVADHVGAPWFLQTVEGLSLYGVYWHHRFSALSNGMVIELPPLAAFWLYQHVAPGAALIVQ